MVNITTIGIDLAKNIFQLHGVNKAGKCMLRKRLKREHLLSELAKMPPCLIGIEACGSAHHWAREFIKRGHTVKMMAPQFVKPYVKSNKNDANDAAAIAEAVMRPDMRFVPIKTLEQQDAQLVHTGRQLHIKQRTALSNQIRGLLGEYGIFLPKGLSYIRSELSWIIEDAENGLTMTARAFFKDAKEQFESVDKKIKKHDEEIERIAESDSRCQRIMEIEGIGPITATALVAAVGNAKEFKRGRELAAWLGLVPKQHSSGNKTRLQAGISKRGDRYLRMLLVHGARAVVNTCEHKTDKRNQWVADKKNRCGRNKAAVALANKNARIAWAVLFNEEAYRSEVVKKKVVKKRARKTLSNEHDVERKKCA